MSQKHGFGARGARPPRPEGALPPARKRFGQHFLKDTRVLDSIVDALGPLAGRTVVEIGPGRGALTDRLVERAGRVIAIELDRDLVQHLRARYAGMAHVEIVEADVLTVSLSALAGPSYVLAGNVPYYITTPIIFHALERPRPDVAVYLVQREVAERMAAPPGDKTYGALSVNLQAVVDVALVRRVPPSAFNPPRSCAEPFKRRKQLIRVVRTVASLDAERAAALLAAAGLDNEVRPETLTAADFARLVRVLTPRPDLGAHS